MKLEFSIFSNIRILLINLEFILRHLSVKNTAECVVIWLFILEGGKTVGGVSPFVSFHQYLDYLASLVFPSICCVLPA